MKAVQVSRFGGPEVLEAVEVDPPQERPGHVADRRPHGGRQLRRHPFHRRHLPRAAAAPVRAGCGGGRHRAGRRARRPPGGRPARRRRRVRRAGAGTRRTPCFPIPDGVTDGAALALVLQGATAWHLLRTSTRLSPGESVVVHAARGRRGVASPSSWPGSGARGESSRPRPPRTSATSPSVSARTQRSTSPRRRDADDRPRPAAGGERRARRRRRARDDRRRRVRRLARRPGPARPAGRLRPGLPDAAGTGLRRWG